MADSKNEKGECAVLRVELHFSHELLDSIDRAKALGEKISLADALNTMCRTYRAEFSRPNPFVNNLRKIDPKLRIDVTSDIISK